MSLSTRFTRNLMATSVILCATCYVGASSTAEIFIDKANGVKITKDITYTTVNLIPSGTANITLDLYEPTGGVLPLKPGFVMCHGGGFAIGSKDGDAVEFPASSGNFINSSITEYATEFAKRGYVCVSINYPKLFDYSANATVFANGTGFFSGIGADTTAIAAALNAFLAFASLPNPIPEATIVNTIEAAIQAAVDAVNWMVANKASLGVDDTRITIGGYSAGATLALLAGNISPDVSAIWLNSGGFTSVPSLVLSPSSPPVIAFHGDADTIVNVALARAIRDELVNNSVPHEYFEMVGEDHFYFIDRIITETPTKAVPDTIENLIADFMFTQMSLGALAAAQVPAGNTAGLAIVAALCLLVGVVYLRRRRNAH